MSAVLGERGAQGGKDGGCLPKKRPREAPRIRRVYPCCEEMGTPTLPTAGNAMPASTLSLVVRRLSLMAAVETLP